MQKLSGFSARSASIVGLLALLAAKTPPPLCSAERSAECLGEGPESSRLSLPVISSPAVEEGSESKLSWPSPPEQLACSLETALSLELIPKINLSSVLPSDQASKLRQVLEACSEGQLQLKVTAQGAEVDGHLRYGFRGAVSFDGEPATNYTLADYPEGTLPKIRALGQFRCIELPLRKEFSPAAQTGCIRDCFGNIITWSCSENGAHLKIFPTSGFCSAEDPTPRREGEAEFLPLSVDLSYFGLPQLEDCFERIALRPLALECAHAFYTNLPRERALLLFSDSAPELSAGVARVENFFGYPAGHWVKQIFLVNSRSANAFFSPRDSEAIEIGDELASEGVPLAPIASHETLHRMNLASPACSEGLQGLFKNLQQTDSGRLFLTELAESWFLPGNAFGGHAGSDPGEFFASFGNSIVSTTSEEWEASMLQRAERDSTFIENYARTLFELEPALRGLCFNGAAPAILRLDEMRRLLEAWLSEEGKISPWAPVLG